MKKGDLVLVRHPRQVLDAVHRIAGVEYHNNQIVDVLTENPVNNVQTHRHPDEVILLSKLPKVDIVVDRTPEAFTAFQETDEAYRRRRDDNLRGMFIEPRPNDVGFVKSYKPNPDVLLKHIDTVSRRFSADSPNMSMYPSGVASKTHVSVEIRNRGYLPVSVEGNYIPVGSDVTIVLDKETVTSKPLLDLVRNGVIEMTANPYYPSNKRVVSFATPEATDIPDDDDREDLQRILDDCSSGQLVVFFGNSDTVVDVAASLNFTTPGRFSYMNTSKCGSKVKLISTEQAHLAFDISLVLNKVKFTVVKNRFGLHGLTFYVNA